MTIEEMALKKYPVFISEYSDSCEEYDSNEADRLTYIEGAMDQRRIDIEKACKWLKKYFAGTYTPIEHVLNIFKQVMEK